MVFLGLVWVGMTSSVQIGLTHLDAFEQARRIRESHLEQYQTLNVPSFNNDIQRVTMSTNSHTSSVQFSSAE